MSMRLKAEVESLRRELATLKEPGARRLTPLGHEYVMRRISRELTLLAHAFSVRVLSWP